MVWKRFLSLLLLRPIGKDPDAVKMRRLLEMVRAAGGA